MFDSKEEFGEIEKFKANIYLLKYDKRSKTSSKAIIINSSDNRFYSTMLNSYSKYLLGFKERTKVAFNPVGHNLDDLPILPLGKVLDKFHELMALISTCNNLAQKEIKDFNEKDSNLIVTEIATDKGTLYFISRYQSLTKMFKYKNIYYCNKGKMILQENENLLLMNYNIDVAILGEKLYIFNIGNFKNIFSYDEDLKTATNNIFPNIKKWRILANVDMFLSFADKKYFYQSLAKIADDSEYLELIEKADPIQIKNKLLLKSNGDFIEEDFNEKGQLVVTEKNCKKIIKLISKEYKYNVFKDSMEG